VKLQECGGVGFNIPVDTKCSSNEVLGEGPGAGQQLGEGPGAGQQRGRQPDAQRYNAIRCCCVQT